MEGPGAKPLGNGNRASKTTLVVSELTMENPVAALALVTSLIPEKAIVSPIPKLSPASRSTE